MFSRAIISALSLFLTVNGQQQTPYQLDCDTTDLTSPPSTNLDDWVNSLLIVLHNNGKTAFEEVLVGFAATEDGYDVLEGMWESTANGGKGESWSLLIPSNEAFAASGLSTPYSQLDETTLYSLVTYHTLPVSLSASLPASGSANSSTSHLILETLFPLANGDGSVIVGDVSGDKVEVVSPIAGSIKLDDLDEGEQTGALTGLGLFEVDTILTPPPSLPTVLSTLTTSTSTLDKDSGLTLYIAALNRTNTLNTLTGFGSSGGSKGLTILAPIDAAFDGSMDSDSVTTWTKVLAGHFSSTQTLYSSDFNSTTKLYTSNGNALSFKTNSTGTYAVSSDGVSVTKILRSDILLENGGVMHVVDTLLASTTLQSTVATNGTTNGTSTSRTGGTLLGAASNVQVGVYGMTLAALVAVVGMF